MIRRPPIIFLACLLLVLATTLAAAGSAPYTEGRPPLKPDPRLSPGEVADNGAGVESVCRPGYAARIRHVSESLKHQVFIAYFGHVPAHPGDFEIDHIISCELNGAQTARNLFPQSYLTSPWNARVKDRLENWMAADVRHCLAAHGRDRAGQLLALHQREMAADWQAAYLKYLGEPPQKK